MQATATLPSLIVNPPDADARGGQPTDAGLRSDARDPAAFRRLFEEHAPPVRRFLRDLLRDPVAADEALQETFVRAHARLHTLRDGEKVLSWLFGIARRVTQEELRARQRRPLTRGDETDERVDQALSAEGQLLKREADQLLAQALGALGEDRRTALLLRIDHELDYQEIGAIMGWPLSTVKNEIHRARLSLRQALGGYVEVESGRS